MDPVPPSEQIDQPVETRLRHIRSETEQILQEKGAVEAYKRVLEFQSKNPGIPREDLADLLDEIAVKLPSTQQNELAARRDRKARELASGKHPSLAVAYYKAAGDLYRGIGTDYKSGKSYLDFWNRLKTQTPSNPSAAATNATQASELSKASNEFSVEAEDKWIAAISDDPLNMSYWMDLAGYYTRHGKIDDARVLYGYVEENTSSPLHGQARIKLDELR